MPSCRGPRKALVRLFQRRLQGEMRPMPAVQVHNKKEAQ